MALIDDINEQLALQEGEDSPRIGIASFLVAADAHSIANDNQTFLEGAAEFASNVPKFIGTSILSGGNQIYNIAPSLGNFFGGNFELSKTADVIQAVDDDFAAYYAEHEEGVDALGFVLSSFVPGIAGIKILNAGQRALVSSIRTGKTGKGLSESFGLLAPNRQKHLDKALLEISNSNSTQRLMNANVQKALAAGFGQSILEAAAFEGMVAATLFDSPVLEGQDGADLLYNIAFGGLVFGAVGGVIDSARTAFAVKKAIRISDAAAAPQSFIKGTQEITSPAEKIISDVEQLDVAPVPVVLSEERKAFLASQLKDRTSQIDNRTRTNLLNLAEGDSEVATVMFNAFKGASFDDTLGTLLNAKDVSRLGAVTKLNKTEAKLRAKIKSGKASIEEELELLDNNTAYIKVHGEGSDILAPIAVKSDYISDILNKGDVIKTSETWLVAGKRDWKFDKPGSKKFTKAENYTPVGKDSLTSQARHIWAINLPPFVKLFKGKVVSIGENDIALMEKAYREFDTLGSSLAIKSELGNNYTFSSAEDLLDFVVARKENIANTLLTTPRTTKLTQEDIANIVNVKTSYLSGERTNSAGRYNANDIFAMQGYSAEYTKKLISKGILKEGAKTLPVWNIPQNLKITYGTKGLKDIDGNVIEGMTTIKENQRQYLDNIKRGIASILGEDAAKFGDIPDKLVIQATREGAGPTFIAAASANPGSLASYTEYLGKTTIDLIEKYQRNMKEALEPALIKVANNKEAAIEWAQVTAKVRGIPDKYKISDEGDSLILLGLDRYTKAIDEGLEVKEFIRKAPDAPDRIPLVNKEVRELAAIHVELNGNRVRSHQTLNSVRGFQSTKEAEAFHPPEVNTNNFPFFALVKDDSLTSTGHSKMIYANSKDDLEAMISNVKGLPGITVLTKEQSESYYKSIGQFEAEKTLNDNYMDALFQRTGVSSPAYIPTDPKKITDELLEWHNQKESGLIRETVATRYERQFEELRTRGDIFTSIATSKFGSLSLTKHADEVIENPYMDYVKTSLGVRNYSDYPFWTSVNKLVESKAADMYRNMGSIFDKAKTADDLVEIETVMRKYGYQGAAYNAKMELLANHTAPKAALSQFVRGSNSLLATVVLRLDPFNAVNNAVGANVLRGPETRSILRAIEAGDSNAIGELTALAKIKVPGTDRFILSPTKLISNAIKDFGTNNAQMKWFKDNGYVPNLSDQYRGVLEELALTGTESAGRLTSKLNGAFSKAKKLGDLGEKLTGNRLAEEFNRFTAAHVMKQLTDLAVKHTGMSAFTQKVYINSFVNRTQGNYLAAQRPMMFQGSIGQAIGLFQTYQFNLMQQLLRHVGEGPAKDSMTLLGLQGTIYGINGLPGFNAINTALVGNASGNEQHKDTFDVVYGAAGKEAGDWLMYGVASNMLLDPDLKVNLYTRGDINPRHVTLVPTDPASVPIVQATAKFMTNIFTTTDKLLKGGDVSTTLLQGLEHNSISRPLAGLAQTLQGLNNPLAASYSTTKRGNVIASNDLVSLANLTRMLGGKPLDEAIAMDRSFRLMSYGMVDSKRRSKLGQAIKSTLIAGQVTSSEQIDTFAAEYAALGGKREEFNSWMIQLYKTANTSQANKLQQDLESPFSKSMQLIMGGYELKDFTNR